MPLVFVSPEERTRTDTTLSGNVSVSTTLVRSMLPVLFTVIVYSIVSPAVSTMASPANVRDLSIVSEGFWSTTLVASSASGTGSSVVTTLAVFTRSVPAFRSACVTV